jgi:hypothetical protein
MDSMPMHGIQSINQRGARERPHYLTKKEYDNEKENSEPETSKCRAHAFRDGRMGMVYCDLILRADRCVMINRSQ